MTAAESWDAFLAARDDRLRLLGTTIAANVRRRDTGHPFFHGCIDWHSAVHGTYALLTIAHLTGDPAFLPDLHERDIRAEVAAVRNGALPDELPYGLAWALHLDIAATRQGITIFQDLAGAARDRLLSGFPARFDSPTHGSAIWPIIALHAWAKSVDDTSAQGWARHAGEAVLAGAGGLRPFYDGFLSPAHLRVQLAQEIAVDPGPEELAAVRASRPLAPAQMRTPYRAGLNFSRSWACHAAWRLTGDACYRDAYVELIVSHLDRPAFWRDDYESHAHWIPQFGVFALARTA